MQKYIIKNCPSCMEYIETNCARTYCCKEFHHTAYCKEYASCLLKQIVEKCKKVDSENFDQWCFANFVLEDIEIEEVNE